MVYDNIVVGSSISALGCIIGLLESKKKFSETKVGQFLAKSAPGILGTVGDILPDNGVLGVVKNLISKEICDNEIHLMRYKTYPR